MFTGIIESIGTLQAITPKGEDVSVTVNVGKLDMGDAVRKLVSEASNILDPQSLQRRGTSRSPALWCGTLVIGLSDGGVVLSSVGIGLSSVGVDLDRVGHRLKCWCRLK